MLPPKTLALYFPLTITKDTIANITIQYAYVFLNNLCWYKHYSALRVLFWIIYVGVILFSFASSPQELLETTVISFFGWKDCRMTKPMIPPKYCFLTRDLTVELFALLYLNPWNLLKQNNEINNKYWHWKHRQVKIKSFRHKHGANTYKSTQTRLCNKVCVKIRNVELELSRT